MWSSETSSAAETAFGVSRDYTGHAPWGFKGGAISKVVIDISGERYANLEMMAMKGD